MEEIEFLSQFIDRELAWLGGFQLSNGALPMIPLQKGKKTKICPYFSEFTALALLTRPERYAENVRRYMEWHLRRLNTAAADYNGLDGTIYDYEVEFTAAGGLQESIPLDPNSGKLSYDSTDSYAALFLELVLTYAKKTGDRDYLLQHREEVERIVSTMFGTLDGGLTWAKPDWKVKYLMDNCEVARGLRAAEEIYAEYFLPPAAEETELKQWHARRKQLADREKKLLDKIEQLLWDEKEQHYLVGVMEKNVSVTESFCWDTYYPDALAQLFPILMDILPPDSPRARELYGQFNRHYSADGMSWEEMQNEKLGIYSVNGLIPWAAMKMGDADRVLRYLRNYDEHIAKRGHPEPAYNAECAEVVMAAALLLQHLQTEVG